jgi:signal transduction histidine kinase
VETAARATAEAAESRSSLRVRELTALLEIERVAHFEAQAAVLSREEILATVSHELRNPLGAVLMTSDSLLRTGLAGPLPAPLRTNLERIQRNASRMQRLLEDLGAYGDPSLATQHADRTWLAPARVIAGSFETLLSVARGHDVRLQRVLSCGLTRVNGDLGRLVQALSNLIANAVQVTPRGGVVSVGAEAREGQVLFWVKDSGVGIAADELGHVFERFWRGRKPGYAGTGLGLAIAKGIVESHGGTLSADRTVGLGSRFWFTLPSVEGAPPRTGSPVEAP